MLERLFQLKKNGTNPKTEVIAGITTFMTMAYILAVNPAILSNAGMNREAVFYSRKGNCLHLYPWPVAHSPLLECPPQIL